MELMYGTSAGSQNCNGSISEHVPLLHKDQKWTLYQRAIYFSGSKKDPPPSSVSLG